MSIVRLALGLAMGSFLFVACTDAGGKLQGGEPKFDTTPPTIPVVPVGDGGGDSGYKVGTAITWTGLYNDYFGRLGGGPGCAGDGKCHGDASQPGSLESSYVCADKDGCFASITSAGSTLVRPKDTASPDKSYLISELRHLSNGIQVGSMPKRPATFVFTATDIKRISDWIAMGAPNN